MYNKRPLNTVIMVSGSGTNMDSIIKNCSDILNIRGVFSDRKDALALEKAGNKNIYNKYLGRDYIDFLSEFIEKERIDLIILAGFLKILPKTFIDCAPLIINIHPSLLPKYGGKGMYGMNVHEEVFKNGDSISGATVHYVNEKIDGGKIILQGHVDIRDACSPEEIQKKVLSVEHKLFSMAIKTIWRQS